MSRNFLYETRWLVGCCLGVAMVLLDVSMTIQLVARVDSSVNPVVWFA